MWILAVSGSVIGIAVFMITWFVKRQRNKHRKTRKEFDEQTPIKMDAIQNRLTQSEPVYEVIDDVYRLPKPTHVYTSAQNPMFGVIHEDDDVVEMYMCVGEQNQEVVDDAQVYDQAKQEAPQIYDVAQQENPQVYDTATQEAEQQIYAFAGSNEMYDVATMPQTYDNPGSLYTKNETENEYLAPVPYDSAAK